MLIEQPPIPYRMLFPETVWRIPMTEKAVYLTFDDGPIPEVTPWVLDVLDHYGIKATFFCVGDNVRKHPATFQQVVERGHSVGNHTMHHLQGAFTTTKRYVADINEADSYIHSALFRPPHGLIRWKQAAAIKGNMRTHSRRGAQQRKAIHTQRLNHRVSRLAEVATAIALGATSRH